MFETSDAHADTAMPIKSRTRLGISHEDIKEQGYNLRLKEDVIHNANKIWTDMSDLTQSLLVLNSFYINLTKSVLTYWIALCMFLTFSIYARELSCFCFGDAGFRVVLELARRRLHQKAADKASYGRLTFKVWTPPTRPLP